MNELTDTGLPWIGPIPKNWEIGKVKNAFDRIKINTQIKEPVVLSLSRSGIKIRDISKNEGLLAKNYEGYLEVEPDDLIINPLSLNDGANCGVSHTSGVVSLKYFVLRAKEGYDPRYYDYFFKTQYWNKGLFAHGKGISYRYRWLINLSDLLAYQIPIPTYKEQQMIADALDSQCKQIDEVILSTKEIILEYQKYRSAVITEAVTKGLNKKAKLKDTHIDWIGKIPDHWQCIAGRTLFSDIFLGMHRSVYDDTKGTLILKVINIKKSGEIDFNCENRIEISEKELCKYQLKKGDLLVSKINGNKDQTGKCAVFDSYPEDVICSDHIIRIRLKEHCSSSYLKWYLNSSSGRVDIEQRILFSHGIYMITEKDLKEMYIPLPPMKEQIEIIDHIEKKCRKIDLIITEKTNLLNDLEEYRRSLICEMIFGRRKLSYA